MKKQGLISSAVFAISLLNPYTEQDTSKPTQSMVTFGGWNTSLTDDFEYIPILDSNSGLWKLPLTSAYFDTISLVSTPEIAIIDSSEPLLIVPEATYSLLLTSICSQLFHACGLTTIKWNCTGALPLDLPDIRLFFDGIEARMTPQSYIEVWNGECTVRLGYGQEWVLGTAFLQEQYSGG